MKKIHLALLCSLWIHGVAINASDVNRKIIHDALDIAIRWRQEGHIGVETICQIIPPCNIEKMIEYRKDYETSHPNIFELYPTIIGSRYDNVISIRVFSQEEAYLIHAQAQAIEAENKKRKNIE